MQEQRYTLWIEAEQWSVGEWNIYDDNTDVIMTFEDGTRWIATFFTYKNIQALIDKNQMTGECLSGKYFWSSDMILIDECSRERIEEVVRYFLIEKTFTNRFRFLGYEEC
ncbi:hypothetical protein [Paenibacillus radicis (ex Xue et al. 2023)]|uniref:Uncharacterized protein n=1 Tax=Paenibacillus radicis (ex Xue et al. 2023) TaxID=2972489 RepID=A0ABT1YL45_9BACL|nr:hypothetical protein [Paenibacillus radicis (ex Xue et al. 2023)]MCR8633910.1 hypothetical protein [Paenibacillus radicis (ex Xue et al. 2023)]